MLCNIYRVYLGTRLHDFVVGVTMTRPTKFPYPPNDIATVMPYLKICYQYAGVAELEMQLNCRQPVIGRYLVITIPGVTERLALADVAVDSDGMCATYHNALHAVPILMPLFI